MPAQLGRVLLLGQYHLVALFEMQQYILHEYITTKVNNRHEKKFYEGRSNCKLTEFFKTFGT